MQVTLLALLHICKLSLIFFIFLDKGITELMLMNSNNVKKVSASICLVYVFAFRGYNIWHEVVCFSMWSNFFRPCSYAILYTLAWQIPWTEEPGGLQSIGSLRVGHNWETSLSLFTFMHWRRKWKRSSALSWRIPGMGKPGGLLSVGSHRVWHNWSDLAAAAAALKQIRYCGGRKHDINKVILMS